MIDLDGYIRALTLPSSVRGEHVHIDGESLPQVEERDGNLWWQDRRVTDTGSWTAFGSSVAPDEKVLVAARVDDSHCERMPLVDWLAPRETVTWVPAVRSGERPAATVIHVVELDSGLATVVQVDTDAVLFWTVVGWLPTGAFLLLVQDLIARNLQLLFVERSGVSRVVVDEHSDTYINGIRAQDTERTATWLPELGLLAWLSERDGWRHLYLYDLDGTCVRRLTVGPFEVSEVVGYDAAAAGIVLLASSDADRPYDVHVCRVDVDGQQFRQLSTERGVHRARLTAEGILDTHSSLHRPPRTDLLPTDGGRPRVLARAEVPDGPLPVSEEVRFLAPDGRTELHGVVWLPSDLDTAASYPVVELLYAGPQNIMHPRDFRQGGAVLGYALANLGFVSFVVDGQGTPGRGKAFQDVGYRRFGQFEVAEHVGALQQLLTERPYLDPTRVGLLGSSWGGYFTVRAMLQSPATYRAGVAIYPIPDLVHSAASPTEPYMGTFAENPEGWEKASNLGLVDQLLGKLLVVAGTDDRSATFAGVMRQVDAFLAADKDVDLLVVPGLDHNTSGPHGPYVMKRIARYLVEHLTPELHSPG